MADVIYIDISDSRPVVAEGEPWLYIEKKDGMFFGSGGAWKESGEWIGYGSLPENDISFERALKAAQVWASRFSVPTIWVFGSE